MNYRTKRNITEKTRLACGLTYILRDCIEEMRFQANVYDVDKLDAAIGDVQETLEHLVNQVSELEYILYMERNK